MKSLIKATLLAVTMTTLLNVPQVFAAEPTASSKSAFKDSDKQAAYALGASLGRYMDNSLKEQTKVGIALDREMLLAGIQDAMADKSKMSDEEIRTTLETFDERVKDAEQKSLQKMTLENGKKGDAFRVKFAKEAGVQKTDSGLLYKIDKAGTGEVPKDTDTVVVNYKGSLIDGTEFDSSYKRNDPLSFQLDKVIAGWTEGLKYVKKGGKIKLVIPPSLAYGEAVVPGIPPNSTLVFDVELLDIKPAPAPTPETKTNKPVDSDAKTE